MSILKSLNSSGLLPYLVKQDNIASFATAHSLPTIHWFNGKVINTDISRKPDSTDL